MAKREPHCPICGYTAKDAAYNLDHGLCKGKIPASKAKLPQAKSEPEERFLLAWRALGGPAPEREYRFAPDRKWRFDFAWPSDRIAVEIEGGINDFGKGRGYHLRKEGFLKDAAKYNRAAVLGWRVWRLAPSQIQPAALEEIIHVLERK